MEVTLVIIRCASSRCRIVYINVRLFSQVGVILVMEASSVEGSQATEALQKAWAACSTCVTPRRSPVSLVKAAGSNLQFNPLSKVLQHGTCISISSRYFIMRNYIIDTVHEHTNQ